MHSSASAQPAIDRRSLLVGAGTVAAAGLLMGGAKDPQVVGWRLQLHLANLKLAVPGVEPGELPPLDGRPVPHAKVTDHQGLPVGTLTSTTVPTTNGHSVVHTFDLPDGTIVGKGSAGPGLEGPHAVVAGTGRYAGAAGAYTIHSDADRHLVTFVFSRGAR